MLERVVIRISSFTRMMKDAIERKEGKGCWR